MDEILDGFSAPSAEKDFVSQLAKKSGGVNGGGSKSGKSGGFESLGFSKPIYSAIKRKGYNVPTPIQRASIPTIQSGKDVVAMARTGSGKTAAFMLPMLDRLSKHSQKIGARGVIIVPTRELALQTRAFMNDFAKFTDLRYVLLVGGDGMEGQFEALSTNPDVLIATPGRLLHHIEEIGLSLGSVEYVVFDEADRLFEQGLEDQLYEILKSMTSGSRQTLLFSATMPKMLIEFTRVGLRDPELIRLDVETKISEQLGLDFFMTRPDAKAAVLIYLLSAVIPAKTSTIIFAATKHHVEYLHALLAHFSFESALIYGSMDQVGRKINIAKFRAGKVPFLIVTDVAARGIDIPLLNNVINYDFPASSKLFVHRVGRAARAGRSGRAYSLLVPDEIGYMLDVHLFLGYRPMTVLDMKKSSKEEQQSLAKNQPYYGSIPAHLVDLYTHDVVSACEKEPLAPLLSASLNAYKLYYKTRSQASASSIRRAKEMMADESGGIPIHPLFKDSMNERQFEQADLVSSIRQFRPKQNIFDIQELKQTPQQIEMMKAKRKQHQKIIEYRKAAAIEAKAKEGIEANDHLVEEDFELGRREAEEAAASSQVKSKEELAADLKKSGHSAALISLLSGNGGGGGGSKQYQGRQLGGRSRAAKKRGKKRKGGHVNDDDSSIAGDERNTKKKKTEFADSEFFLSYTPGNNAAEEGLSLGGQGGRGGEDSNIHDLVLDLVPDDQDSLKQVKQSKKWDRKKKKYVTVNAQSGMDKAFKRRNESGAVISGKKGKKISYYEEWKAKTKKSIPTAGMETSTSASKNANFRQRMSGRNKVFGGGEDEGANSNSNKSKDPEMMGRRARRSMKKTHRNELRSSADIAKRRKDKELKEKLAAAAHSKKKGGKKRR